jgi:predicted Zn finger-like uncharacterized protein
VIVECSNCDTRFQLDDARVPLRGIRVRCSRCKEAFFLEHPDAKKEDVVNDVAEQAAHGAPPDATRDLASGAPRSRATSEPEEEDWEFNADVPDDMDADLGSTDDDEPFGGGMGPGASSGLDLDAEGIGDDDGSIPGLGVDDMSVDDEDLTSGIDLAGGDSPDVVADAAGDAEPESDFGDMSDFSALADPSPAEPAAAPAPPAAAPAPTPAQAAAAPSQEIGEPEDWDFFSDDSGEDPSLGSMDDAMGRVMEAVEDPSRMRAPARDPDMGGVRSDQTPRLEGLRSLGRGIGWIVTCCLLGLGLARGVLNEATASAPTATGVDFGVFEAQQVRGAWLETARGTQLYAVSGLLVNDSAEPRMPGTSLRVALLGHDEAPLQVPAAQAGLPLPESELRELPTDELLWMYQRAVKELSVVRLEPGQAVAFQAFFESLPDEATGFVLQMQGTPPPLPRSVPQPVAPVDAGGDPLEAFAAGDEMPAAGEATSSGSSVFPPRPTPPSARP